MVVGMYFLLQGGRFAALRALGARLGASLVAVNFHVSRESARDRLRPGKGQFCCTHLLGDSNHRDLRFLLRGGSLPGVGDSVS